MTDITGRDGYIICKALAYAIEAIDRLPKEFKEASDQRDMIKLLDAHAHDSATQYRTMARGHLTRRGIAVENGKLTVAPSGSADVVPIKPQQRDAKTQKAQREGSMGELHIAIDANVNGKSFHHNFVWDCGPDEVKNLLRETVQTAEQQKMSVEQLAQGLLRELPSMGMPTDPVKQRGQMVWITAFVLRIPIKDHDPPGIVADFAADEVIYASVEVRDKKISVDLKGESIS